MRSRTATWFECKIRYEKTMEDGLPKKVSEVYVVDALSFSEAEERIMEEMLPYNLVDIEIVDVKIAPYREVFFADNHSIFNNTVSAGDLIYVGEGIFINANNPFDENGEVKAVEFRKDIKCKGGYGYGFTL